MTGQGTPQLPAEAVVAPPAAAHPLPEPPRFTPTRSGMRIRLPGSGEFAPALRSLAEALREGPELRGLAVTVDAAGRPLAVGQLREIEVLILERHGAALLQVVEGQRETSAEGAGGGRPGRRAAGEGRRSAEPGKGGQRRSVRRSAHEPGATRPVPVADAAAPAPAAVRSGGVRTTEAAAPEVEPTLLLRRTLRSGQRVRYPGNVVVMGDVNPGAEIVAAGDIVVMGTLRGVAHAGATGSTEAIVAAFRLQPTQIRVGAVIGRAPDGRAARPEMPEVARLRDGALVIERYVPAVD